MTIVKNSDRTGVERTEASPLGVTLQRPLTMKTLKTPMANTVEVT